VTVTTDGPGHPDHWHLLSLARAGAPGPAHPPRRRANRAREWAGGALRLAAAMGPRPARGQPESLTRSDLKQTGPVELRVRVLSRQCLFVTVTVGRATQ
jgi:hypothetical protein